MNEKITYHHGDLRQALIDSAIELILEKDVSTLSLREIARRVGVSHAAPYRHFEDKEALLAAVAEEGFIALTQSMSQARDRASSDPLNRLEAIALAYVQYAIAHPTHYRVMFGSRKEKSGRHPASIEAGEAAFLVLLGAIEIGQAAKMIRSGDLKQLAWVAWSLVHGLAMLLIEEILPISQQKDIDTLTSFVTHTLVGGLASKSVVKD
ncbi:MAG: TetR/AcrR family transcriptional regulator [Xenococcaceae cyanobacterium]